MKRKVINVLLTALPVIATGFLGSFFMMIAKIDYESLAKPLFAPKGIVFPIAWSILYLLIIISGYLFLKDKVYSRQAVKRRR